MCETNQVVEVHEITMRALLDLLAPVVMGTDDEYVRYLVRGCECFAPDSLPMVRVGDWLLVSGRVRFGGSFGQVMICSAHGTLDYAFACAGASARYDRSHPSTFSVFEYEVWHVVEDSPEVSEPLRQMREASTLAPTRTMRRRHPAPHYYAVGHAYGIEDAFDLVCIYRFDSRAARDAAVDALNDLELCRYGYLRAEAVTSREVMRRFPGAMRSGVFDSPADMLEMLGA